MSDFQDISELFEGENDPNEPEMAENDPNLTHLVLPDPEIGPVEWACWFCQADDPIYTVEIINQVSGDGVTYNLCHECGERLLGNFEEGKGPDDRAD
jgi:hypothetical protein